MTQRFKRRKAMDLIERVKPLDLYVDVPRSSKETLAGIVHLPRMIDKARALKNNTLGEYVYPCPLDRQVLNFLAADAEDFADLAEVNDDDQMTAWAEETSRARTGKERDLLSRKILNRKVDPEDLSFFMKKRALTDSARADVTTWDALTDLEEGHI
jgi:hypothetical protein